MQICQVFISFSLFILPFSDFYVFPLWLRCSGPKLHQVNERKTRQKDLTPAPKALEVVELDRPFAGSGNINITSPAYLCKDVA
jgi:hypothetical protein